jgi:hypothetical protein
VPPREPGEWVGLGNGPLPGCPPPRDLCFLPSCRPVAGGMRKPGNPGYPRCQCSFPPLVRRGPSPGSTKETPEAFSPGALAAGSPVAGVTADPNSTPSGNDAPPPPRHSATTMAPGTTSAPRHATTSQGARRGPPARGRATGRRATGGGGTGRGSDGRDGTGSGGDGRAATDQPSGRVARSRCGWVTRTARPAATGTTRSGRVTRGTVRRDCMTHPPKLRSRQALAFSARGTSVRGILGPPASPQRPIPSREENKFKTGHFRV